MLSATPESFLPDIPLHPARPWAFRPPLPEVIDLRTPRELAQASAAQSVLEYLEAFTPYITDINSPMAKHVIAFAAMDLWRPESGWSSRAQVGLERALEAAKPS